jgi:hypothetical protein
MVGMASIAAHAAECFPFLNCSTWVWWQVAQVSGVGIFTLTISLADVCWSPWHEMQVTSTWLCLLSFQSETMLGVTLVWHSTHCAGVAVCAVSETDEIRSKEARAAKTRGCVQADDGMSASWNRGLFSLQVAAGCDGYHSQSVENS